MGACNVAAVVATAFLRSVLLRLSLVIRRNLFPVILAILPGDGCLRVGFPVKDALRTQHLVRLHASVDIHPGLGCIHVDGRISQKGVAFTLCLASSAVIAEVLNGDEPAVGVAGDREAVAVQIHLATDCVDAFSFHCTKDDLRDVIGLATGLVALERRGRWDIFKSFFNDGGHGGCHRAMAVNHGVPAEARVPFRMRRGCGRCEAGFRELSAGRRDDDRERKRWAIRNTVHDRNTAEAHCVLGVTHRGIVKEFVERGHDSG